MDSFGLNPVRGTLVPNSSSNVTESEWLTCTDHIDLIRFLGNRVNGRRLRYLRSRAVGDKRSCSLTKGPPIGTLWTSQKNTPTSLRLSKILPAYTNCVTTMLTMSVTL